MRNRRLGLFGLVLSLSFGLGASACKKDAAPPPEYPGEESVIAFDENDPSAPLPADPEPDPAVPEGCQTLEGCVATADQVLGTGDLEGAAKRLEYACNQDHMPGCAGLGRLLAKGIDGKPDTEAALALLDRACEAGEALGCQDAAAIHNDQLGDPARAMEYLDRGCALEDATSCGMLGLFHLQGVGVAQDEKKGLALLEQSCTLGREDACEAVKDLKAQQSAKVPGANLNVGSLEADGLSVRGLECKISGGGGLFGSMALVGALAKRKKAFDKCAPKGEAPDVWWTFSGGKTKDIRVEGVDAKVGACVKNAMAKVPAAMSAECAATILIGNKKAAEAAAAKKSGPT